MKVSVKVDTEIFDVMKLLYTQAWSGVMWSQICYVEVN